MQREEIKNDLKTVQTLIQNQPAKKSNGHSYKVYNWIYTRLVSLLHNCQNTKIAAGHSSHVKHLLTTKDHYCLK